MPKDVEDQAVSATNLADSIRLRMAKLAVPSEMVDLAISLVPVEIEGVLVYGSRARGDAVDSSDLDLLALVQYPRRTVNSGPVALSFYTAEQLRTGIGSLFGAHLARDAHILYDPKNTLMDCVAGMGRVDTDLLFERARGFSQLFGSLDRDLPKYLPGLVREARYLLRSCLYASAIAEGDPCFSVRELARRYNDSSLADLLTSRPFGVASKAELEECLCRLRDLIGSIPRNPHGSLEALIVNEWDSSEELVAMALLALGGSNADSDYTEVKKVLL